MEKIPLSADDVVPIDAIASDIVGLRILFVNVFAVGGRRGWTLIDAGLYGSGERIKRWARGHFGDQPPDGIVLTHAHFDHVGAVEPLAEHWDVPVFVHVEEVPYVTGARPYPPPDPSVGGGMMARVAALYPREPINLSSRVRVLPSDGTVPTLPGWRSIHTPGHTAGHVSLFREADGPLVVGDAFCTTKQESFFAVAMQRPELHGPPSYFTTDWEAARASVRRLAALDPACIAPGHGQPMAGADVSRQLRQLAASFDEVAIPRQGRYVERPVRG